MLQVRQGVFETNSSSSHSIIIKKKNLPLSEKVNAEWRIRKKDENDPKNGKLTFYWDDLEFERSPFHFLVDWYDRLCYSIASFNSKKTVDELEEICSRRLEGFKGFDFSLVGHGSNKEKEYYGYVDHQSHGLLEGVLEKYHISVEDFVFNDRYVVVIDGDELQYFQTLTEQEFFDREAIEGIESADQWYRWDKDEENDDIVDVLESDKVRKLYNKHWYPEALYLLAMLDYLCRENDVPVCTKYNDIRVQKLERPVFPIGVLLTSEVLKSDEPIKKAEEDAIPEFRRFNIIESEVRNVV